MNPGRRTQEPADFLRFLDGQAIITINSPSAVRALKRAQANVGNAYQFRSEIVHAIQIRAREAARSDWESSQAKAGQRRRGAPKPPANVVRFERTA